MSFSKLKNNTIKEKFIKLENIGESNGKFSYVSVLSLSLSFLKEEPRALDFRLKHLKILYKSKIKILNFTDTNLM